MTNKLSPILNDLRRAVGELGDPAIRRRIDDAINALCDTVSASQSAPEPKQQESEKPFPFSVSLTADTVGELAELLPQIMPTTGALLVLSLKGEKLVCESVGITDPAGADKLVSDLRQRGIGLTIYSPGNKT